MPFYVSFAASIVFLLTASHGDKIHKKRFVMLFFSFIWPMKNIKKCNIRRTQVNETFALVLL